MTPDPSAPLPLSHPVRVDDIKLRGSHIVVRAQAAELPAIAAHLGLASVEALEARYVASRSGDKVKLEGTILAKLHQTCIVSLDAFPVELKVPVRLDFAPEEESRIAARRAETEGEGKIDIEVQLNEDDPPEPIVDGIIDLGTVTLEFLALGLDPYPRKPGVSFEAGPAEPEVESPFAALAKLKRGE
jgi:uncharacterized metal-binding protein YceD (DUF177 family)